MRTARITRALGSGVYWVEFLEAGERVDIARCYVTRWGARRAARRFIAGKLYPFEEVLP